MSFEPQKFFIGLIDLFSVWLPGALLTYVVQQDMEPLIAQLGYRLPRPGVESWAVFLVISYIIGHFIFVAGSIVLDRIANRIRDAGKNDWNDVTAEKKVSDPESAPSERETRLEPCEAPKEKTRWQGSWEALREKLRSLKHSIGGHLFGEVDRAALDRAAGPPVQASAQTEGARRAEAWKDRKKKTRAYKFWKAFWERRRRLTRSISRRLFDVEDWEALDWACAQKQRHLSLIDADQAVNCFQWSKARLTLENPEALAIVERFEADSKFFRSLCVVLVILLFWGGVTLNPLMFFASLVLLPAAFWRFVELRGKATSQAYWFILTLDTTPPRGRLA